LNAISTALITDLHAALDRAMHDSAVRVVILTGAGDRAFCAGDDLREARDVDQAEVKRQVELIQDITRLIVFGEKPVLAAVNGWAVGGGFEWVMNCDLSIWSDTARGFLPELSLGLGVTGGVTSLLPRLVGWQRAHALFLLGEKQTAARLLELGLAHAVVAPDQLMTETRRIAERLAALPAAAVAGLKRAIAHAHRDEIERALAAEAESVTGLFQDPETRKRVAAFSKAT
jgi:enoyl-CoA hydratase/carnithine racemase